MIYIFYLSSSLLSIPVDDPRSACCAQRHGVPSLWDGGPASQREKTAHQETSQCIHALHEGEEGRRDQGVHTEGVCSH